MDGDNDEILEHVKVDVDNLYKEELFTDLRLGSFRRLTPVNLDGSPDSSRKIFFTGHTQLMSKAGLLPINCPIEAETLEEAVQKFPGAIKQAVDEMVEKAQQMEREHASRIIRVGEDSGYIHKP